MSKKQEADMNGFSKKRMQVVLVGETPLLIHNFSHKAKAQMLAKQVKVTFPKEAKDPIEQYTAATYYIDEEGKEIPCPAPMRMITEGKVNEFISLFSDHMKTLQKIENPIYGTPARGIKASAVRAGKSMGYKMVDLRCSFFIDREYIEIHGEREMNESIVRISQNTTDIRFRPMFSNWWIEFEVTYNELAFSRQQIIDLFNAGGTTCGIGEWRNEKGGQYGAYRVATAEEIAKLKTGIQAA